MLSCVVFIRASSWWWVLQTRFGEAHIHPRILRAFFIPPCGLNQMASDAVALPLSYANAIPDGISPPELPTGDFNKISQHEAI